MRIKNFFSLRNSSFIIGLLLPITLAITLSLTAFHLQQKQEVQQKAKGVDVIAHTKVASTPSGQPPTPATTMGYPASDGHIYWSGDFETGDTSQWDGVHTGGKWGNSSIKTVTSPVRWGKYAGKFTVYGGGKYADRAEISASQQQTGGYPGQEWYYSWSTYVPSIPNATSPWGFHADITQWMDLYHRCSPPLFVEILTGPPLQFNMQSDILDNHNKCKSIGPHHEWNMGTFQYDQWNDFTVHIKWSEDPTVGFVEAWRNGVKVVPLTYMRTLDTSGGVYMEQALYHPGNGGTHVIYHDGTRRHDAYGG